MTRVSTSVLILAYLMMLLCVASLATLFSTDLHALVTGLGINLGLCWAACVALFIAGHVLRQLERIAAALERAPTPTATAEAPSASTNIQWADGRR